MIALCTYMVLKFWPRSLSSVVNQVVDIANIMSPGQVRPPSSRMAIHSMGEESTTMVVPDSGGSDFGVCVLFSVSG